MKKIKNDSIEELLELLDSLLKAGALKKIVLSKPDATDEIKSVISPKKISDAVVLQVETFSKDNKAYHLNIRDKFIKQCEPLFYSHAQINIISTLGDCQYMRSKSGKETIIGVNKIKNALNSDVIDAVEYSSNNKSKNYILSGKEHFLKGLGISDGNGRIRDKMQAKFRQINKFLEHIKSVEEHLPDEEINVYDLCCGKSYLSFA
ncbi:MAG: hypothetical protein J6A54_02435, partial [Clostridia bacterium]|nr:hypothetical protein [Clostridia bacterium]